MKTNFGLHELTLDTEYRTGERDPSESFYKPCINKSNEYKRAVGFFRSSIFLIIQREIIEYAKRGGIIKLICSPSLSADDIKSIEDGYKTREEIISNNLISEIDNLDGQVESSKHTKILATLVALGILDIKIAVRPESHGQYHEKIGVFKDQYGNKISFVGSANETWSGWHYLGNHEAIEVFRSWISNEEKERVNRHDLYFDRLWENNVKGVDVVEFPNAAKMHLINKSLDNLDRALDLIKDGQNSKSRIPFKHQTDALNAWKENKKRGILEHATGSGKTFTAIIAIREHLEKGCPALILVPSKILLSQWANEIKENIDSPVVLLAGAGNSKWKSKNLLRAMLSQVKTKEKRIVISTMQTAAKDEFVNSIQKSNDLLLVADEVHQTGSPFNSNIFKIDAKYRLGLSATPKRYGDPDGTERMVEYFGGIIKPAFTLHDAINSGRLVNYEYYPHEINLTNDEASEWKRYTKKILHELNNCKDDNGNFRLSEKAKIFLIQRSRIAKKANNKISLAKEIIKSNYRDGQRWLIYCEDIDHLKEVQSELKKINIDAIEYHSEMLGDKEQTLKWFTDFGGIVVSIKCLDEGVDIPAVDNALILSSSQNPRQFIQRRGRVLRKHPGKNKAVIHDAIVVPISEISEPDQISLLKSELKRAIEFAESAINKNSAISLRIIAANLGINLEDKSENGFEEDNENE